MAALGLAACSSPTIGSGTTAPTTGANQPTNGGGTPSTADSGGNGASSLSSVQPCNLLSSAVMSQYGLSPASSITVPDARPCNWSKPVDINGNNGYSVEIDIREHQGLKDINTAGSTITQDNIGTHPGRQFSLDAGGSCTVSIGVTNASRVDVGVTAGTDTNQACQVANNLAKVVEPQLPASG